METPFLIEFEDANPKYLQIVDAVIDAIRTRKLTRGQRVPSINELSEEFLLSRDTVEKAYRELRRRGIITSVKGKGYFIHRTDIQASLRIMLVFNKISNYKKQIYNSFVRTLGNDAKVDLYIHHFNAHIFKTLIDNALGLYDYYVIMPHFYEETELVLETIQQIPSEKLILLDRNLPQLKQIYGAVYQDFEMDICNALYEAEDMLRRYQELILVFPEIIPYPPEIVRGFKRFCLETNTEFDIIREISSSTPIQKGEVYVVIEETDLVNLIKQCRSKNLRVGKDIGIISYNETPLKEILLDGITVITTNHEEMGKLAAELILEKKSEHIKNEFHLIRRHSL
ncbi:MAG: GntR family transcriptional regulator [Thermoflavifilum sp.]|nr:GntR family transcriptional regulator [Thermoflavifilum sp.]